MLEAAAAILKDGRITTAEIPGGLQMLQHSGIQLANTVSNCSV